MAPYSAARPPTSLLVHTMIVILSFLVICADARLRGLRQVVPRCKQGYVWREACRGDYVCVTADVREAAKQDNSLASARRAGGGAYGPDTCVQGYVWREACGPSDHVCVIPATRSQAGADNAAAASRVEPPMPSYYQLGANKPSNACFDTKYCQTKLPQAPDCCDADGICSRTHATYACILVMDSTTRIPIHPCTSRDVSGWGYLKNANVMTPEQYRSWYESIKNQPCNK